MEEESLNGTIERLRDAIVQVDCKVTELKSKLDLISAQLIDISVRVEMHGEALKNAKTHGEDIARLDTYVKLMWAIITITILGLGVGLLTRLVV